MKTSATSFSIVEPKRVLLGLLLAACVSQYAPAFAASGRRALRSIAAIENHQASTAPAVLPFSLRAQVTYVDAEWRLLFVRDATGSVFVQLPPKAARLERGDIVDLTGLTTPGSTGITVNSAAVRVVGKSPLPPPLRLPLDAIKSGAADSQDVLSEGIVRPGPPIWHHTSLLLVDRNTSMPLVIPGEADAAAQALIGARAFVRGVAAERLDSANHIIGYQLFVPGLGDIEPQQASWHDQFSSPAEPVAEVSRCKVTQRFLPPVRVRGKVLWTGSEELVIGDASGSVKVKWAGEARVKAGEVVDVLGFPRLEDHSVMLEDALIQVLDSHPAAMPAARPMTAIEALHFGRDGEAVRLSGQVVSEARGSKDRYVLIRDHSTTFELVVSGHERPGAFVTLMPETDIEAEGILRHVIYGGKQADSIQLLVDSPSEIVIRTASHVNWRLVAVAMMLAIVLAVFMWNIQLRRALRVKMTLLRVQLEAEAHLENRYRRLIERNLAAVFAWRPSGEITHCNQAFARMLGYRSPDEVIGRSYWSLLIGDAKLAIEEPLRAGTVNEMESSLRRADGGTVHLLENITRVQDEHGIYFETTAIDITQTKSDRMELQRARDAARKESEVDLLTGLPNRRRFTQLLQQQLASAAAARRQRVGLLYLDLDGFKEINDTSGHLIGDMLLQEAAARMRSVLSPGDELCRIGGDEFAVLLTREDSIADAEGLAARLLSTLEPAFMIASQELRISASIGISEFPNCAADYTALLQQADSAMYVAKRAGRNRSVFYTSDIGTAMRERNQLIAELRGAIDRQEIFLHYQPEFSRSAHELVRFEALARWKNRALGSVPPGRFIPIAEESGKILELGAHILELACRDAVAWQHRTGRAVPVAVNISTAQLRSESFFDDVMAVLRKTGLSPHLLELEMTESIMLEDPEQCRKMLARLRSAGILLALDDFGTGYSSLSYLPDLPFDRVKIARSFLAKVHRGRGGEALIQAVVSVAHNLGMRVVVEGVETERELEFIRSVGADEVQGYLLGRPGPDACSFIERAVAAERCTGSALRELPQRTRLASGISIEGI